MDLGPEGSEMKRSPRIAAALLTLTACAALPASSYAAEAWLQPETLSKPGTSNDQADLATNSPGVAAVIWSEFANNRTPRFRILVSTRQPNARWAPPQQLSGPDEAGTGAIGVDPQGRITAVWSEGLASTMMYALKLPGQPWSAAAPIPDGDGGNPDIVVASDGTATAVWQKGTTADTLVIRAARRPVGGPWSAVETISPAWSYRPHVEGDTAGDVTVSYTHEAAGGTQRYMYAVDRPNSGPWGTQTPVGGPALTDNVSDLVVAPNSGLAAVFWQDGSLTAPMAARVRTLGTAWSAGTTTPISGGTAGRLDLSERDRAAVDGQGLVTAVWTAGKKVLTAYRSETTGTWTAPTPPAEIDPGDGAMPLENSQIASNAFGRAVATWTAVGSANRFALRGPGGGAPWSAPKPIDAVPADAVPLDLAVDDTGRVVYAWSAELGLNNDTLAISTYGNPLQNPQPPAPGGPAPPTNPPGGGGGGSAKAALKGTPTSAKGVKFVVTMPAAGSAKITLFRARAGKASVAAAAARFKRVGVVRKQLKQGRNVVTVKKVRKRKLARGRYRAIIAASAGGQKLKPVRVTFKIKR
jgi:hypothetical protein